MLKLRGVVFFVCLAGLIMVGCRRVEVQPAAVRSLDEATAEQIATVVNREIEAGKIPGAVVLVGDDRGVLYCEAFGKRSLAPEITALAKDDIFDIASLSKPVATAACIMILIDRGQLGLEDRVADIIPEFAAAGKEEVRIKHLLSHTSGLPAYTDAGKLAEKYGSPCKEAVLGRIYSLKLQSEVGEKFRYSCLGFITLGRIVEIVSGQGLDEFANENLFGPLGMSSTGYNPDERLRNKIVPTQIRDGKPLCGQVHDPLAALMGSVSGNAGIFAPAEDLGKYCLMLINGGRYGGKKILSEEAVRLLTTEQAEGRAYGFDVNSSYAWIKGDGFSPSAFCHSGFTGTSIVCDPVQKKYLIILTNRVHPDGKGAVRDLRVGVAECVAGTSTPQ